MAHRLEPLRSLLVEAAGVSPDSIADLSFSELRDALLVLDPLSKPWVVRVNRAEAEFWKRWVSCRAAIQFTWVCSARCCLIDPVTGWCEHTWHDTESTISKACKTVSKASTKA